MPAFSELDLVERLDRLLPQTQCGQCGYSGCRPYAHAMARGEADSDHCPPGGDACARALAHLLGRTAKGYDRARGRHNAPPLLAFIEEDMCIGCTKCIQACPVDAIVGGAQAMHTVIAAHCTGCARCLPVCPMDCITLHATTTQTMTQHSAATFLTISTDRHSASDHLPLQPSARSKATHSAPSPGHCAMTQTLDTRSQNDRPFAPAGGSAPWLNAGATTSHCDTT